MNARLMSLIIICLCGIALWQSMIITESGMYSEVGARFFPQALTTILTILGLIYWILSIRRKMPDLIENKDNIPLDKSNQRIIFFLGGGLVFICLIKFIGFLISATICGSLIARAFDAKLDARCILVCGSISVFFWILFSIGLGVELGPLISLTILYGYF